jgi:tRNA-dihydrouridine synthase
MVSAPTIYLAPFQGITGNIYRQVYASHFPFIHKFFTPFLSGIPESKILANKKVELFSTHHSGIPVVPQILSNDAEQIIRFSNHCALKGFQEINWNLGCPFPRVARKKRGAGLLPYPELIGQILDKVMNTIRIPFSIKCRLGYQDPEEIFHLLDMFRDYGILELIVHARIGIQMYKGETDLDAFERLYDKSGSPTVYNGDIFRVDQYKYLSGKFPDLRSWMIGRGILVDPFLPADIIEPKAIDKQGRNYLIQRFVDDLYYNYRKEKQDRLHAIDVMKELWEYMSYSFDNPTRVFSLLKKTRNFDEYEDAVHRVFNEFNWLGSGAGHFNSNSI